MVVATTADVVTTVGAVTMVGAVTTAAAEMTTGDAETTVVTMVNVKMADAKTSRNSKNLLKKKSTVLSAMRTITKTTMVAIMAAETVAVIMLKKRRQSHTKKLHQYLNLNQTVIAIPVAIPVLLPIQVPIQAATPDAVPIQAAIPDVTATVTTPQKPLLNPHQNVTNPRVSHLVTVKRATKVPEKLNQH